MKKVKLVGIWIVLVSIVLLTAVTSFCQEEEVIKIGCMRECVVGFLLNHCVEADLFAKHGVNVEVNYVGDEVPAFLYRKVQISQLSPLEVAEFVNRGWPITMLTPMNLSGNQILVRKDSPYQSITDLVGKRFGQYGWATGGTTQFQVILKKWHNLDLAEDFENIVAQPAALIALLDRGDVDCINLYDHLPIKLLASGDYRAITPTFSDIWTEVTGQPLIMGALVAHDDWLGTHLDDLKRITAAYAEGNKYLFDHPQETGQKYAKWVGIKDPKTIPQLGDFYKDLTDIDWTIELILAQEEFLKEAAELDVVIEEVPRKPLFRMLE